jgi:hypothetical protein
MVLGAFAKKWRTEELDKTAMNTAQDIPCRM